MALRCGDLLGCGLDGIGMTDFTCSECGENFEADFPFGDDVQCTVCKVWLATEMEEDWDNLYAWVTGKSEDQNQKAP
ncbi:MAG: hypothetical protein KAJ19_26080 [Gammaproteobacteria bacterium]|nr:hypothetical protein [Gammaproteobacteria bacterium]